MLGGDNDFVYRFMNSPFALTDEDINILEANTTSFIIPFIHSIIAKFSDKFPNSLDAKIDMCWQTVDGGYIQLDFTDDILLQSGGKGGVAVKDDGIPHAWYLGPGLLKKEHIKQYQDNGKQLKPKRASFRDLSKVRKGMLDNYDIVVAQGVSGPFENCVFGIGFANFARFARKEPGFLQEHMDFQWETYEKPALKLLMKQKPEIVMCGDDYGYNSGLQMNVKNWRKFIKPKLAEYVKIAHDGGAKFILHSCGAIGEIFPDFVEIGIDGVESLKPKNNDLAMYRDQYPEITLVGTIDDSDMLISQSPAFIRQSVRKDIQVLGKKGGYIPGPTNFLLDHPPENIVALFKAIQEFGKYK